MATDVVCSDVYWNIIFDEETLEKVESLGVLYKMYVMKCVKETKAGNTYERHRS